ncbi:MAG: hypothetical protein WD359_05190 [Dehalococcoidia bacterium]
MAARNQKGATTAPSPTLTEAQRSKIANLPDWRWRTFPVFFAFFVGMLVMAVLNGAPDNQLAAIAQFVVLAALSYGLARIVVRKLLMERRLTRREKQIARGEPVDDEYEDVVVYPEQNKR